MFQVKEEKKLGVYCRKDVKRETLWTLYCPVSLSCRSNHREGCMEHLHGSRFKKFGETGLPAKIGRMGRKKYLKQDPRKEYTFGDLLEWYLDHPKAKRKKTYQRDVEMGKILRENFGMRLARDIRPTDIEVFQDRMLITLSKRRRPFKPATVNRFVTLFKRVYNLAIRMIWLRKTPVGKCLAARKKCERSNCFTRRVRDASK